MYDIRGQVLEPVSEQDQLMFARSPSHRQYRKLFNPTGCPLPLAGIKSVQNGLRRLIMLSVPEASTMMEDGDKISMHML
jgi:hypothetical protein